MLYDKRWDRVRVPAFNPKRDDPFKLETLVAWLETMPADGAYDYSDVDDCLLAQYFTACGFKRVWVGFGQFTHRRFIRRRSESYQPVFDAIAMVEPRTFGTALERARGALAVQP